MSTANPASAFLPKSPVNDQIPSFAIAYLKTYTDNLHSCVSARLLQQSSCVSLPDPPANPPCLLAATASDLPSETALAPPTSLLQQLLLEPGSRAGRGLHINPRPSLCYAAQIRSTEDALALHDFLERHSDHCSIESHVWAGESPDKKTNILRAKSTANTGHLKDDTNNRH